MVYGEPRIFVSADNGDAPLVAVLLERGRLGRRVVCVRERVKNVSVIYIFPAAALRPVH